MDSAYETFLTTTKFHMQDAREKGGCRVYFRYEGKPIFLSIRDEAGRPLKDPGQASKHQGRVLRSWWEKARPKAPEAPQNDALLEVRVRAFLLDYYDPQYYSQGTIDGVEDNLEEMLDLLPGYTVKQVTRRVFKEVVVPGIKPKVKAKTWANKLADMKRFFRWEIEQEDEDGNPHLEADPTLGTKRPPKSAFGTREMIWEEEWYPQVREVVPEGLRPILDDFWYTGMDTSDLFQFEPKRHLTTDGKGNPKIYKKRAKESEIIDQPLNSKIRERWVARFKAAKAGERLHPTTLRSAKTWGNWIRKEVNKAQDKLGLPRVDIKSMRHTFATRHVKRLVRGEKNAPTLDEIRRWMGHAKDSRVLEKIYARLQSSAELMD